MSRDRISEKSSPISWQINGQKDEENDLKNEQETGKNEGKEKGQKKSDKEGTKAKEKSEKNEQPGLDPAVKDTTRNEQISLKTNAETTAKEKLLKEKQTHLDEAEKEEKEEQNNSNEAEKEEKEGISNPNKPEVKLILLSYMRSGSSFTADLFNQHRDVFYIYEPLWAFDFFFKMGKPLHFIDGRPPVMYKHNDTLLDIVQKDTIRSILSCQLQNLGYSVFKIMMAGFAAPRTKRIKDFLRCFSNVNTVENLKRCLPLLQKSCDSAKVTLVKALRLSMKQALTLMREDPGLKVVHLVRDPRAVQNSRKETGVGLSYNETADKFCPRVLQDVMDSQIVRKLYPDRILTVRYEDLTSDPLNYTRRLLEFAGLDFSPEHQNIVKKKTSSGNKEHGMTMVRSDSKAKAEKWRLTINFRLARNADWKCSDLYKQIGYVSFPDEAALRNLSRPFYTDCKNVPNPVICLQ